MNIGLYNLEPHIENTALMQISQYHKSKGDRVEGYNHLLKGCYDKVYASSLFNFTDKSMVTKDMVCGGTGFDIHSRLPKDIEICDLDYSIYPSCDVSYIWFSRGCVRKCPFCIVWKKEGCIYPVKPKNLNPNGRTIAIMDNNFFANPEWMASIQKLIDWKQPVRFDSGLDVRLFNEKQGEALAKIKLGKVVHIAWDNPNENLIPMITLMTKYVKPYKITCYVLVGYDSTPEQDMMRVMKLRELNVNPFVMPYNKSEYYQRNFARWVNFKAIFKSVTWEEYKKTGALV